MQLAETLGGAPSRAELTAFLDGAADDHDDVVGQWLQVLIEHGIVRQAGDGVIACLPDESVHNVVGTTTR